MHTRTHTHILALTHTRTYAHSRTHSHTRTHSHAHAHTQEPSAPSAGCLLSEEDDDGSGGYLGFVLPPRGVLVAINL